MMQASLEVAACDRKLQEERRQDGLGIFLRHWTDAASALRSGLSRARPDLERHGTPREHLERVDQRLEHLLDRARSFDLQADLDACASSWEHLALELGSLAGPQRDALMRLLGAHRGNVDRATAGLSEARKTGGMHPERHRRVRELEAQRDQAQVKYARLREECLAAERGHPHRGEAHSKPPRSGAVEHRVSRFQVALGDALHEARNLRVLSVDPRLDRALDRDRHLRDGVAGRLEKTLGSLSTAAHRTLTDPNAGELRGHLARMDSILARLKGKKAAQELLDGAREIGSVLADMGTAAESSGGAAHLQSFRKLLEERRSALARLAGEARKASGAEAMQVRGALPQPSALALGERHLERLRKLHPGIDSLLRSIRRRDTEIDRLLGGAPERTLADLAAMPGFGVARLEPRSSGGARGHLLWHPARAAALLYAFALPPARRAYRIELELDDGRVQAGPAFEPDPEGDAVLAIRLPVVGARLRGVTVVQEPGARAVLGARLGAAPAGG